MRIVIIGAGFTGLGTAIRLKQSGIDDFAILERAQDLGGTWRDNSYPGCAVDVQSHLYSYSFAPNPDWSHVYAPQEEIWSYIRRCADEHDVTAHIRFGHDVIGAEWDESSQCWTVATTQGPIEAQFLVSGMGPLANPSLPDIAGIESFEGTWFHSARWDHDHDLDGERVAVIGTGCSAAQIIPEIQPRVERLLVFQRTPAWTFPRANRRITDLEHRLYRRFPALQRAARERQYLYREAIRLMFGSARRLQLMEAMMRLRLRRHVPDPELRAKLTPTYRMGCKRIIVTDDYHRSLTEPNVDVITGGIREVRPHAIVTEDGAEHPVDTIILATGFGVIEVADPLRGRDGVPLAERWIPRRQAYLGTCVAGYPNYFMLVGPNTATGHTSVLLYAEAQIDYIIQCLRYLEQRGLSSFDVRPEVQSAYNEGLQERLERSVWTSGGCKSWYLDADGKTSAMWPGYTWEYRRALSTFDAGDYELRSAPRAPAVAA